MYVHYFLCIIPSERKIAIVFRIAKSKIYGETVKSNSWIHSFGSYWEAIPLDIRMDIGIKTIYWIAILPSYLCFRGKEVNIFEMNLWFIVFNSNNHWRLGIIEKPAEFMEGNTWVTPSKLWWQYLTSKKAYFTFWIRFEMDPRRPKMLSCFRPYFWNTLKANPLWRAALPSMSLRHDFSYLFNWSSFINHIKQVPLQGNSKDCACFTIYFGKKFFLNPDSTMALVKVYLNDPFCQSMLISNIRRDFLLQKIG